MKLIIAILLFSITANAQPRLEAGIIQSHSTMNYSNDGFSGSNSSTRTYAVFGLGYSKDLSQFIMEGNVSISIPSIQAIDTSPLRFELNVGKNITDSFLIKAGPSISHFTNNSGVIERTSYGYQIAGQFSFNEKQFITAGLFHSTYKGSIGRVSFKQESNDLGIKFGYSF